MPRVSVIVPTFNNGSLLAETLDSALGQTCTDCELIVVDDGSTDDTATIVQRDYPIARYIFQPNRGPAAARNADRKSTRLNSSHIQKSRMPSSA